MKRTKTKRFFSIVMAALMVLCMTATALATEPVAPTPIGIGTDTPGAAQNVTKTWTAASVNQLNDTEVFEFELEYVNAAPVGTNPTAVPQYNSADFVSKTVEITHTWQTSATVNPDGSASASNSLGFASLFSGITFSAPGAYNFTLEEVAGDNPNIVYSNAVFNITVYVAWALDSNGYPTNELAITGIATNNSAGEKQASGPAFPNTAADAANLTVSKNVTGNAANVNDYFEFTVNITGGASGTYAISYVGNTYAGTPANPTVITAGTAATIYLKHGESFTILNLPVGAAYSVAETNALGYTTTINGTAANEDRSITGTIAQGGATAAYVNNKTFTPPTGLFMDIMPYALIFGAAAIGAVAFIARRRRVSAY